MSANPQYSPEITITYRHGTSAGDVPGDMFEIPELPYFRARKKLYRSSTPVMGSLKPIHDQSILQLSSDQTPWHLRIVTTEAELEGYWFRTDDPQISWWNPPTLYAEIDSRQAQIERLKNLYALRNENRVIEFLRLHDYLFSLIFEIPEQIRKYFPDTHLYLRIIRDPDSKTLDEWLILDVSTDLSAREAIDRREKFIKEWWRSNRSRSNGNLSIFLEYK